MSTWARAGYIDDYAEDGEGVVMLLDGRVVALTAVAWSVVEALAYEPHDQRQLRRRLVEQFGTPRAENGDDLSLELTEVTLIDLLEAGLVVRLEVEGPDPGSYPVGGL